MPSRHRLLKLRGFVLAMATLALHLMLIVVAVQVAFTGGPMGVTGIPKFAVFGMPLADDRSVLLVRLAAGVRRGLIGLRIDGSSIGRALRAIAASEQAAGSVGIDIIRHKVQMFVIGGGMASVSGSLLVHYLRATDPTVFSFSYSINLITGTIIGGLTSIWGGALGAAIIIFLRELLRELALPLWESVIMGALTVLVLIVFPRGIAGFVSGIYDALLGGAPPPRVTVTEPGAVALPTSVEAPPLQLENVSRSFGSLRAVSQVGFTVQPGSITALIGPNGAGKTTLFNLVSGHLRLDEGTDPLRSARDPVTVAARHRPPRHRPHVPEPAIVRQHDGAGERHVRPSSLRRFGGRTGGARRIGLRRAARRRRSRSNGIAVWPSAAGGDRPRAGIAAVIAVDG